MGDKYQDISVACANCGINFPIIHMELDSRSEALLCKNCAANPGAKVTKIKEDYPEVKPKPSLVKDVELLAKKPQPERNPNMITNTLKKENPFTKHNDEKTKYKCMTCGFILYRRPDSPVKKCPYCDKQTLRVLKKPEIKP